MSLGEHQKEMVALARQQNVVVSGKSGIGKTFAAAFFIREMLLDHPESKALVLVTSVAKTTEVFKLVSRLCSEKVAVASEDVAHLWQDAAHSKRECAQARVLCVSPSIASHLFYVFATAATFTERLATKYIKVPHLQRPRLFAMVSKPLSELDLPTSRNPLYKLVTAFCISQPTFRKRATIAPIIVETFQYESSNYADAIGHPVDFLRGANPLHCNAEALYASLLTLGNVSSQYDVLTIESRRKRFVTAAEAILEQLGLWCFLKFIELELRHELKDTLDRQIDNGMDAQAINILTTMDVVPPVMDPKSRIEHHADVQQTQTFLAWVVEQQHKHGLGATNARLKKVADLYGSYMDNARETGRCWVFLQRRVHTRVVAEYMTACFPAYPPCCSMLGSGHGSVAGLDKSDVKAADVEKLFNEGRSPLLVTTAMSTEVEHIAPCDLVICMDEVVDPHKLVDFRQRADPDHGVFKYVIPDTPMELDKYRALFGKMAMLLSLDGTGPSTTETLDQAVVPRRNTQQHGRKHHHGRVKYELYHADVKAKMTLENSIQILTAFCHTLPGIKIYDNRPLYMIQRHLMGRLDGRKRCRTDTADDGMIDHRKFLFSASLKLPSMLRVKHNISTPKCIAAFKAVELLLKRGFLDRSFKSKLLVNRTFIPQESVDEDMELETQNSYDIPPATAVEMGLSPVKSKLLRDGDDNDDAVMHLYGLQGMQYGILCTEPIYGGKTSGRWRFELPTSDVMKPAVQHVPLTVHPTKVTLRQSDLKMALKFHVMLMRLICYGLEAAMSPTNGDIDTEFSSKNDKGYVVVPTLCPVGGGCLDIDWAGLHNVMQSALLRPAWPMSGECGNCIYVSNKRRNVAYVIKKVTTTMVGDVARRVVSNDQYWSYTLRRAKSALLTASPDQPLVHAIEIPGAVPLIRFVHEGKAQLDFGELKERLLIPDQTSILALTKQQYFDAIRLVPLLFEFERKCQLSTLMHAIGCDIDAKHMEEATTKPAYERLETLGDCFLKLESTWWLYQEAITHPSVAQWLIQADKSTTNVVWKGDYERLEYLGDALIEYLVVSYAYVQYPTWQPGALSDWKGATVCNDALGKAALICFHMDQIMLTGSMRMDPALETKLAHIKRLHAEGSSERPHVTMPKIFADGFEALCAAVFLDSGCDLHVIRDIFLGPLLSVIGADAVALVTRKNAPKPADLCLPRDTPIAFDAHDDDDGVAHVVADPAAHEPSVADDAPVEETVATTAGEAPVAFEAPAAGRTGGDDVVKRARPTPRPIVSSTTPVEIIEIDDSDDD
ncbi:hypothetical protein DYB32_005567 [Aphanomyces invadans]|uniref:RNase III domain-containing protein n=1 Tax=Aphanomyces invadans TaxID=157072 RepID=A0A3R6VWD8_9STRA|nr:hypothetical protein DYB32_005567 [Aphanomyces invadans]